MVPWGGVPVQKGGGALNPHPGGERRRDSLGRGVQIVAFDNCPSESRGSLRSPAACL
jgi:hypothetical protein